MKILRTDVETGEETVISIEEAVERLTGWWINPKEALMKGEEPFTPYAKYGMIQYIPHNI